MVIHQKRFIIVLLCLIFSNLAIFASGKVEVEKADTSVPAGETQFLLADFEDSTMPMWLYQGDKSTIKTVFDTKNVKEGSQSLKITAKAQDTTGIEIPIPAAKGDWSELISLKMWIYGANSGNMIRFIIEDSDYEQFAQVKYDIKNGWYQLSLPIANFKSRSDVQDPLAKVNGEINYPVKFLHFFSSNSCDFTLYYDYIIVTDEGQGKMMKEKAQREAMLKMQPEPVPEGRRAIPAFKAMQAAQIPGLDGIMNPGEWENAIVYPFSYNQLSLKDLRMPAVTNLDANWRVLYQGNTLYGAVQRFDDVTVTDHAASYENDCLEILFKIQNDFTQLRTVVGADWEANNYKGERKAVWSASGDVLEFSVVLPPPDLAGKIFGWLIAMADNDSSRRVRQVYPVNGKNAGYQGKDFTEIEFVKKDTPGERMGMAHLALPFRAASAMNLPVIDGKPDSDQWEWENGIIYPLSFNQLDSNNLTPPPAHDLAGDFRIVYKDNTIYGLVSRTDDLTFTGAENARDNDAVEINLELNGNRISLCAVAGKDFADSAFQGAKQAIWSEKGDFLEFYLEVPGEALKGLIAGFNLALSDNDGDGAVKYRLYPVPGTDQTPQGQELCEIKFD